MYVQIANKLGNPKRKKKYGRFLSSMQITM
jgi:hypothetical protein